PVTCPLVYDFSSSSHFDDRPPPSFPTRRSSDLLVEPVIAAIGQRIEQRVVIGDPRVEGVTMGALASLEQLADVRAAVQDMIDAGGELAFGRLDAPAVRVAPERDAVAEFGAFMSPVVLRWADARNPLVHSREAFGPVSSVIGYDNLDEAVRLAAMGAGSLVATVCSNEIGRAS